MGARREARKTAIRALYAVDALEVDQETAWKMVTTEEKSDKVLKFARKLVEGTLENLEFVDNLILENTENWDIDRIASVDKTIIRIGFFEIFFLDTVPRNVAINEAVELAKYFSSRKSHKFVNGILDTGSEDAEKDK